MNLYKLCSHLWISAKIEGRRESQPQSLHLYKNYILINDFFLVYILRGDACQGQFGKGLHLIFLFLGTLPKTMFEVIISLKIYYEGEFVLLSDKDCKLLSSWECF